MKKSVEDLDFQLISCRFLHTVPRLWFFSLISEERLLPLSPRRTAVRRRIGHICAQSSVEKERRGAPSAGLTLCRRESTLFWSLGYSKALQSFLSPVPLAVTQWADDALCVSGLTDISQYRFSRGKFLSLVSPGSSAWGQEWRTEVSS